MPEQFASLALLAISCIANAVPLHLLLASLFLDPWTRRVLYTDLCDGCWDSTNLFQADFPPEQ